MDRRPDRRRVQQPGGALRSTGARGPGRRGDPRRAGRRPRGDLWASDGGLSPRGGGCPAGTDPRRAPGRHLAPQRGPHSLGVRSSLRDRARTRREQRHAEPRRARRSRAAGDAVLRGGSSDRARRRSAPVRELHELRGRSRLRALPLPEAALSPGDPPRARLGDALDQLLRPHVLQQGALPHLARHRAHARHARGARRGAATWVGPLRPRDVRVRGPDARRVGAALLRGDHDALEPRPVQPRLPRRPPGSGAR